VDEAAESRYLNRLIYEYRLEHKLPMADPPTMEELNRAIIWWQRPMVDATFSENLLLASAFKKANNDLLREAGRHAQEVRPPLEADPQGGHG
jgi:hypothetical protein